MIAAGILVFIILALYDFPALLRARERRELIVYVLVAVTALVCITVIASGRGLWSPIRALGDFTQRTLRLDYTAWRDGIQVKR